MKNITWDNIICTFASTGCNSTKDRKLREFSNKRWQKLRFTPLDQTSGSDFLQLLYNGGTATSVYLKAVQAIAIETGLITHPVLPKKIWPKHTPKPRRAITEEEHRRLCSNTRRYYWRVFYEILWETGAAQSDAAHLRIENTDLIKGIITYQRLKTGIRAAQAISPKLIKMLKGLSARRKKGFFTHFLQKMDSKDRATLFRRKCKSLKISGITLHSYRYAWAERAFELGLPERMAMVALGHNSAAVHRAYAKNAKIVCPSLCEIAEDKSPFLSTY